MIWILIISIIILLFIIINVYENFSIPLPSELYESSRRTLHVEPCINDYVKQKTPNMWTFWHDINKCPTIVKTNFECIEHMYPDWNLIIMTNDNIHEYIPKHIIELVSDKIIPHQADMYRLYILKQYGGLWIDSSILIKDTNFINNLYNTCFEKNKIALFEITYDNNDSGFPVLENWFIMSPHPNHIIIELWYKEFLKANRMNFKNYREMISSQIKVDHVFKGSEYLTMHACIQYIIQMNPNLLNDIIIYKSEETMFYIQHISNWNANKYKRNFLKYGSYLPCIKLRGGERDIMKDYDAKMYYTF